MLTNAVALPIIERNAPGVLDALFDTERTGWSARTCSRDALVRAFGDRMLFAITPDDAASRRSFREGETLADAWLRSPPPWLDDVQRRLLEAGRSTPTSWWSVKEFDAEGFVVARDLLREVPEVRIEADLVPGTIACMRVVHMDDEPVVFGALPGYLPDSALTAAEKLRGEIEGNEPQGIAEVRDLSACVTARFINAFAALRSPGHDR
jgi:hypothetical protein